MLKKKFGDCISTYCVLRASQRAETPSSRAAAAQQPSMPSRHSTFDIIARSFWWDRHSLFMPQKETFFFFTSNLELTRSL